MMEQYQLLTLGSSTTDAYYSVSLYLVPARALLTVSDRNRNQTSLIKRIFIGLLNQLLGLTGTRDSF